MTGVQTCALPISRAIAQDKTLQGQLRIAQLRIAAAKEGRDEASARKAVKDVEDLKLKLSKYTQPETQVFDNIQIAKPRSEERRVGKECVSIGIGKMSFYILVDKLIRPSLHILTCCRKI